MAGINDNLVEDYRTVITNTLLSSEKIVEILGNNQYEIDPQDSTKKNADNLVWKNILPQQFIPNTVTDTESYVFYDIDENVVIRNTAYTELIIYFWVVTHKDTVIYKNKLKNDLLVREIKNLFRKQSDLGISKNHLIYNRIFDTKTVDFTGRIVAYKVTDWSDKIRNDK